MAYPAEIHKFRDPRFRYIVSSRNITPDVSVIDHLKIQYIYLDFKQISQVFGAVAMPSPLYGGRSYDPYHSLTEGHVRELYDHGIGLALNLTNHFFDRNAYDASLNLLHNHHRTGNSVIVSNNELARQIRADFPLYTLKASIIKNINTLEKVDRAYRLYDDITLPMDKNDDPEFLKRIPEKERIILFGNASCAYTCPARTCYLGFSQKNLGRDVTSSCSKSRLPRVEKGPVFFDVDAFYGMGFEHFKLVPLLFEHTDAVTRRVSWNKTRIGKTDYYRKPDAQVISYRKCGRTWLRFILANYLNELLSLNRVIDLYSFFEVLPNESGSPAKGPEVYGFFDRKDVPYITFSHAENARNGYRGKRVFLIRSPYDVMVSDYYQQTEQLKSYSGSLSDFIRDETNGIKAYCRFMNDWADELNDESDCVVSYEDMSRNTRKTVEKLLEYLLIPVDRDILDHAVCQSSFRRMQEMEIQNGMADYRCDPENGFDFRMRDGRVGGFRQHLEPSHIAYLDKIMEEDLNRNTRKLLCKHGCMDEAQEKFAAFVL